MMEIQVSDVSIRKYRTNTDPNDGPIRHVILKLTIAGGGGVVNAKLTPEAFAKLVPEVDSTGVQVLIEEWAKEADTITAMLGDSAAKLAKGLKSELGTRRGTQSSTLAEATPEERPVG